PLADHDLAGDELLAAPAGSRPGDAQRPAGAQARDELPLERTPALHIQSLEDRLMRDPHAPIIGEFEREPPGDLFRAPGPGPAAICRVAVAAADEADLGSGDQLTGGRGDHPGQAILHVLAQCLVRGELGHLGPAGTPLGVPLRGRRPVLHPVTASRCVAAQLPRDRRWRAPHTAGDLAHPLLLRAQNRDLLALSERQVPPRQRGQRDGRHPASLPEPPRANGLRHTRPYCRVLARRAAGDRLPEPHAILAPRGRRPAWRPHLPAHRTNRLLAFPGTHTATPPDRGVATTS